MRQRAKTAFRILLLALVVLVVFWPWLLRALDLLWLLLYGELLTSGHWWNSTWSYGGYQLWPVVTMLIGLISTGIWLAIVEFTRR